MKFYVEILRAEAALKMTARGWVGGWQVAIGGLGSMGTGGRMPEELGMRKRV
jgi:hypothetical protein